MALARVAVLVTGARIPLVIPSGWKTETARQFPKSHHLLNEDQLRALAEAALSVYDRELSYAISAVGLERGGLSEALFLLLRARALPEKEFVRRGVCSAAAAELARRQRDMVLVDEALKFLRDDLATDGPEITLEEAAGILKKEKAATKFPKGKVRGPDYSDLAPEPCQCPECRRARGQYVDPSEFLDFDDDEDDDEDMDGLDLPPDMYQALNELFTRMARGGRPAGPKKKGKRK
jgi:hypothetical protein